MLIKEYRIPMPMSVEEYRIAQLYMIQVSLFALIFDLRLKAVTGAAQIVGVDCV